jgi:type IV secretion system protein VirB9
MSRVRLWIGVSLGVLLSGCVLHDAPLDPALPAPKRTALPAEEARDLSVSAGTPDVQAAEVTYLPVAKTVLPPPPPAPPAPRQRAHRSVSSDQVIREANKAAVVAATRDGYFDGRAEQRFVYQPGKIYDIPTSPNHPTAITLPPGERAASKPALNTGQDGDWELLPLEMGEGEYRQEVYIVRAVRPGLEVTIQLFTLANRAYYCRLRSRAEAGLIAVTWELPQAYALSPPATATSAPPTRARVTTVAVAPPKVALDRLFTGYAITVTSKQRPPWVPTQVFDDGSRTYIRFAEALSFTASPAVFGVHADRSPSPLQFFPYTSPEGQLTYVVNDLHPLPQLRGTDGMTVDILREAVHGH